MKRLLPLLTALLLCMLPLSGCKKYTRSVAYTLPCDMSDGYTWITKMDSTNEGRVSILQDYQAGKDGVPGQMTFTFTGTKAGTVNVLLYYIRPEDWSGKSIENAIGQASYELIVNEDLYIDNAITSSVILPDNLK